MKSFQSLVTAAKKNPNAERVYIPLRLWESLCRPLFRGKGAPPNDVLRIVSSGTVEGIKIYLVNEDHHKHESLRFV